MLKTLFLRYYSCFVTACIVSVLWACNPALPQQPTPIVTLSPSAIYTKFPATLTPTNTSTPTIVPSATAAPTVTSTLLPTLAPHKWISSEPLITFGAYGGDGSCGSSYPDFMLLPNGQLFFIKVEQNTWSLQTANLSRQETCQLLNSIDQTGFFDYDPSTYIVDPQIQGASTTYISVKAWQSKQINLYGLSIFVSEYDKGHLDSNIPTL